jgi:predicted dehydrogenase
MKTKLKVGMVGGGSRGNIGLTHRIAMRVAGDFEFVAGALSSNPEIALESAKALGIEDRSYSSFEEMAEKESHREDGIDLIVVATPNHLHYPVVKAFAEKGIHVVSDKPMTATLEEAEKLCRIVTDSGIVFALTYCYSGYPMLREAKEMIRHEKLGKLRRVIIEYKSGSTLDPKQKELPWRYDPGKSGVGGVITDVGTHAAHLVSFVSGLKIEQVAAELESYNPSKLDDDAQMLLRLERGVRGYMWCSRIAYGYSNDIKLQIYGSKGSLSWTQDNSNILLWGQKGETSIVVKRAGLEGAEYGFGGFLGKAGHPEGYVEAFAQIYSDIAEIIYARMENRESDVKALWVPSLEEGLDGMRFVHAAVESSRRNAAWTSIDGIQEAK